MGSPPPDINVNTATATAKQAIGPESKGTLAPFWVGLAILLFFPLGLFLLWRHPTLGKSGKWWTAGIAWACLVIFNMGDSDTASTDPPTPSVPSPVTPERPPQATKRGTRKKPVMKAPPFANEPEKAAAYKEGWENGVAMGHAWLDEIESKANGMKPAEFLKKHPEESAALEQKRFALLTEIGTAAMQEGEVITALVNSGVSPETTEKHPRYLAAAARAQSVGGRSDGFNAVVDPLLFGK